MFRSPLPPLLADGWNAAAVSQLIGPSVAVILGLGIYFLTSRRDHRIWRNQKVIERRLDVIDKMSPDINKVYCYYVWIGRWKEFTPRQIFELKRKLDDVFFPNEYLFTPRLRPVYEAFIDTYYKHCTGANQDGKLLTRVIRYPNDLPPDVEKSEDRSEACPRWNQDWEAAYFARDQPSTASEIVLREQELRAAYKRLMEAFAGEIEIATPRSGRRERAPARNTVQRLRQQETANAPSTSAAHPAVANNPDAPLVVDVVTLNQPAQASDPQAEIRP